MEVKEIEDDYSPSGITTIFFLFCLHFLFLDVGMNI